MDALAKMKVRFETSSQKSQVGRARVKLSPDATWMLDSFVGVIMPKDKVPKLEDLLLPEQWSLVQPASFAVSAGAETASAEVGHLASVRLQTEGTREVLCVSSTGLWNHLNKPGVTMSIDTLCSWLKAASQEDLQGLRDGGNEIFCATLGPMDALYLPAAHVFVESVGRADCIGARCSLLLQAHVPALQALNMNLLSAKDGNELLQAAIDGMALQGA